jgi:hypothetical protein
VIILEAISFLFKKESRKAGVWDRKVGSAGLVVNGDRFGEGHTKTKLGDSHYVIQLAGKQSG